MFFGVRNYLGPEPTVFIPNPIKRDFCISCKVPLSRLYLRFGPKAFDEALDIAVSSACSSLDRFYTRGNFTWSSLSIKDPYI